MKQEISRITRGDWPGKLLGMLVFLGGIGLLLLTFRLAYEMFAVPPEDALHVGKGQVLDWALAGQSFAVLILRVLLLVVMGLTASFIANRGIKLYSDCIRRHAQPAAADSDTSP
jgi:hypothetical protein